MGAEVSPDLPSCGFREKQQWNSRQRHNLGYLMAPRGTGFPPLAYLTDTGTAAGHSSMVLGDQEEGNRDTSRTE